jgi:hypothetical protein
VDLIRTAVETCSNFTLFHQSLKLLLEGFRV